MASDPLGDFLRQYEEYLHGRRTLSDIIRLRYENVRRPMTESEFINLYEGWCCQLSDGMYPTRVISRGRPLAGWTVTLTHDGRAAPECSGILARSDTSSVLSSLAEVQALSVALDPGPEMPKILRAFEAGQKTHELLRDHVISFQEVALRTAATYGSARFPDSWEGKPEIVQSLRFLLRARSVALSALAARLIRDGRIAT